MIVPSPRTWVVGEILTAAKLNTDIRDAINFLLSPPLFELNHSSGISPATSTQAVMPFDTETIDRDNGHSTVTNSSRYTSQTAGYYMISGAVGFVSNATGKREMTILVNGTTETYPCSIPGTASGFGGMIVAGRVYLAVADYVELYIWQNSGGALATNTTKGGPRFGGHWISK
ncbi:hypothetical protein OIE13_05935 [Streptosporangium sp. NBC_01810]|uniref:hypothetical protein n=1 Tax=Streptosporangium sp. NBC_01810 TaxID=2975951 RepID=UPI002DD94D9A|nr:hypothetical protein [Streptosporangium sp. NBC_01810]WSA27413.1 hypothetical protein OIE13_05935 [Streptosporangium sp. NBC_01810]